MKAHKAVLAVVAAAAMMLAGCSSGSSSSTSSSGSGKEIEAYFFMTTGSPVYETMKELAAEYQDQTGTKVNISIDTSNYESNMKVRMASGNLPDVFATHGWSVMRYSQFLEPLTDQSWAQYVNTALDSSMRDSNGDLYALPIEYTVTGINANFDVLEKAGIDPDSINTWDDFNKALAAVKAQGITPIVVGGKDQSPAGNLANFIAAGAFTDSEISTIEDGTFDPSVWQKNVLDMVNDWAEAGYFNPDYSSASTDDMALQIAQGEAAFSFAQPTLLTTALTYNEDANIGFIPIPSAIGDRYLVGGEGVNSYGVAKNSDVKEEALDFLNFLAQPENAKKLAEANGTYSGLTNVDVDLGKIQSSFDKWVKPGELETKPFFDRAYLPNGMWSTIISTTDSVITQQATPADAAEQMKTEFDTLYGQQDN